MLSSCNILACCREISSPACRESGESSRARQTSVKTMVEVKVTAHCAEGFKTVHVVGDVPQLGEWEPASACALQRSGGVGPWRGRFTVPQSKPRTAKKRDALHICNHPILQVFVHYNSSLRVCPLREMIRIGSGRYSLLIFPRHHLLCTQNARYSGRRERLREY